METPEGTLDFDTLKSLADSKSLEIFFFPTID